MLVLQPRDKKILSLLSKFGVLSTRQISALCFVNTSHTTVMRRLRMLEAEDIILRLTGHSQGLGVWCLTTKGANLGGLPQPFRYGNRNTLEHDVTVSELRLSLEGEGLGLDWISESEMKRERGIEYGGRSIEALVPDGIFTFTNDDVPKVVAVEAELSPKNHSRYDKLFHQYARKNSLDYVWYITANASISNLIARRWAQSLRYNFSPALIL